MLRSLAVNVVDLAIRINNDFKCQELQPLRILAEEMIFPLLMRSNLIFGKDAVHIVKVPDFFQEYLSYTLKLAFSVEDLILLQSTIRLTKDPILLWFEDLEKAFVFGHNTIALEKGKAIIRMHEAENNQENISEEIVGDEYLYEGICESINFYKLLEKKDVQ
jgi:hypothetical protein